MHGEELHVGARIAEQRGLRGLTQSELAERAGLWQSNLSNIERGRKMPTLPTLRKLAHAMRIPVTAIIDDTRPVGMGNGL